MKIGIFFGHMVVMNWPANPVLIRRLFYVVNVGEFLPVYGPYACVILLVKTCIQLYINERCMTLGMEFLAD